MNRSQGILYIADPLSGKGIPQLQCKHTPQITLIFDENERYLSLAQAALWRMRRECSRVCIAARGYGACIAAALAVQLNVERMVLQDSRIFSAETARMPRELARLRRYVRRNLALAVSDTVLLDAREGEIRSMARNLRHGRLCALEETALQEACIAPWEQLCEKNLLIPWKCV